MLGSKTEIGIEKDGLVDEGWDGGRRGGHVVRPVSHGGGHLVDGAHHGGERGGGDDAAQLVRVEVGHGLQREIKVSRETHKKVFYSPAPG